MANKPWWWRFMLRKPRTGFLAKASGSDREIGYLSPAGADGRRSIVAREKAEVFETRRAADDAVNAMLDAGDQPDISFHVDAIK